MKVFLDISVKFFLHLLWLCRWQTDSCWEDCSYSSGCRRSSGDEVESLSLNTREKSLGEIIDGDALSLVRHHTQEILLIIVFIVLRNFWAAFSTHGIMVLLNHSLIISLLMFWIRIQVIKNSGQIFQVWERKRIWYSLQTSRLWCLLIHKGRKLRI